MAIQVHERVCAWLRHLAGPRFTRAGVCLSCNRATNARGRGERDSMTITGQSIPAARVDQLITTEEGDEVLVYDQAAHLFITST